MASSRRTSATDLLLNSIDTTSDMAFLKDSASRTGLEKLLQSMTLDDLLSRSVPSQLDELFTGHMEQQLWKSYQQQETREDTPDFFTEGVPQEVEVFPKKATRGRARTRPHPCTNGQYTGEEVVKKGDSKSLSEKRNCKTNHPNSDSKSGVCEEREQLPDNFSSSSADIRQPAEKSSSPKWTDLSFVDGSRFSDCLSEDWMEETKKTVPRHQLRKEPAPSNRLLKDVPLTEETIQRIVEALEARVAPRLDAIQNSVRSIQSTLHTVQMHLPRALEHYSNGSEKRTKTTKEGRIFDDGCSKPENVDPDLEAGIQKSDEQFEDASEPGQIILGSYAAERIRENNNVLSSGNVICNTGQKGPAPVQMTCGPTEKPSRPWEGYYKVKSIKSLLGKGEAGKERASSKIISRARRIMSYNMDLSSSACSKARIQAAKKQANEEHLPESKPDDPKDIETPEVPDFSEPNSAVASIGNCSSHEGSISHNTLSEANSQREVTQTNQAYSESESKEEYDEKQICEFSSVLSVSFSESMNAGKSCYEAVPFHEGTNYNWKDSGQSETSGFFSTELATESVHSCYETVPVGREEPNQSYISDFSSTGSAIATASYAEQDVLTNSENREKGCRTSASYTESHDTIDISPALFLTKNRIHSISCSDEPTTKITDARNSDAEIESHTTDARSKSDSSAQLSEKKITNQGCVEDKSSNSRQSLFMSKIKVPSEEHEVECEISSKNAQSFSDVSPSEYFIEKKDANSHRQEPREDSLLSLSLPSVPTNPHWRTLQYRQSGRHNLLRELGENIDGRDETESRNSKTDMSIPKSAISIKTGVPTTADTMAASVNQGFNCPAILAASRSGLSSHPSDEEDELKANKVMIESHTQDAEANQHIERLKNTLNSATASDFESMCKVAEIPFMPCENGRISTQQPVPALKTSSNSCLTDEKSDTEGSCLTDERTLNDFDNSEAWSNSLVESVALHKLLGAKELPNFEIRNKVEGAARRPFVLPASHLSLPDNFDSPSRVCKTRSFPLLYPKIDKALPECSTLSGPMKSKDPALKNSVVQKEVEGTFDEKDDDADKKGSIDNPQPNQNGNEVGRHPSEIVVVPHEMTSPCTSLVSGLSYPDSKAPLVHPDGYHISSPTTDASLSPPNTLCCSPTSPVKWVDMDTDIGKRKKKSSLEANKETAEYKDDEIGAVVWANPNAASRAIPTFEDFTQNNPAFAIIAQKIAEAEATLKAEVARGSIEKLKQQKLSYGNDSGKDTEKLTSVTEQRNACPTTTILTDNDNHNIEIVHMSSAALFDHPLSPDRSMESGGASLNLYCGKDDDEYRAEPKRHENEEYPPASLTNAESTNPSKMSSRKASSKSPKTSFLERFRCKREQMEKCAMPASAPLPEEKAELKAEMQKSINNEDIPGHESMHCTPSSSTVNSDTKTDISIDLGPIEDMVQEENAEQDEAQIYAIVRRYYQYHQRYNAGNPKEFAMPLEKRLEQPLDHLLSWTMVAFESIEQDFLTSFHTKAKGDDTKKAVDDEAVEREESSAEATNKGGSNKEDPAITEKKKNYKRADHVLERVGIFGIESGSSDSVSSSATSGGYDGDNLSLRSYEEEDSMFYYRCTDSD